MLKLPPLLASLGVVLALLPQLSHAAFTTPAVTYPTSDGPLYVATADFNGDGHLDLAVTNYNDDTVSILLGAGDGTFGAKTDFATGSRPHGVAVADFNCDGHLDLAVANNNASTVSILLGAGDGTFGAKTDFAMGSRPIGVAVADFNGDGHLDLAVANNNADTVSILLGVGDGTFSPKTDWAMGVNPQGIVVADFDGDGTSDLAVGGFNASQVYVRLGNGDGTFGDAAAFAAGGRSSFLSAADLNGDGHLDLAVANGADNTLSILLGNGDGSFQPQVTYATGVLPLESAIADFDGDGVLDIAVANRNSPSVSLLRGNGDGTFQPRVDYAMSGAFGVATGDFNGDGAADLAVTGWTANVVSVLLGIPVAPIDTTPDAFTFTDQTGVALNTVITSNSITVSGIDAAAPISIASCTGTNCQYAVNGGAWSSDAATVNNGDTVQVRQTSSGSYSSQTDLTLDIGGVTDTFSVTTGAAPPPPPPAPAPSLYDDGVVSCDYLGCTANDEDGVRTVVLSDLSPGTGGEGASLEIEAVHYPASSGQGVAHRLTVNAADGNVLFSGTASSDLPGGQVLIGEDEVSGLPGAFSRVSGQEGAEYEMHTLSDGSVLHRLTLPDGRVTEVVSQVPGGTTHIHADGRIVTEVPATVNGQDVRVLAETLPDGRGSLRYRVFDELLNDWREVSQTVDPITPFEAGHRIVIEASGNGLRAVVRTHVERDIYF